MPTNGYGLGFVTNQDVVVEQLVDPVAIELCISSNSGKLAYIESSFQIALLSNVGIDFPYDYADNGTRHTDIIIAKKREPSQSTLQEGFHLHRKRATVRYFIIPKISPPILTNISPHLFHHPINSVPDAEAQRQNDSWSAQGRLFEFPGKDSHYQDAGYYAYDFGEHGIVFFQFLIDRIIRS